MEKQIIFCKKVKFSSKLVMVYSGNKRTWENQTLLSEITGIIIGTRTLWDGELQSKFLDNEYVPFIFNYKKVKAYLIETDLKSDLIYVDVRCVSEIEEK